MPYKNWFSSFRNLGATEATVMLRNCNPYHILITAGLVCVCVVYGWMASLLVWHVKIVEFSNGPVLTVIASLPLSLFVGFRAARAGGTSFLKGGVAIILVCFVGASIPPRESRSPSDPIHRIRSQSAFRNPLTFDQTYGLLAATGVSPIVVNLRQVREFINRPFSRRNRYRE